MAFYFKNKNNNNKGTCLIVAAFVFIMPNFTLDKRGELSEEEYNHAMGYNT
jgi:hypothetical protein